MLPNLNALELYLLCSSFQMTVFGGVVPFPSQTFLPTFVLKKDQYETHTHLSRNPPQHCSFSHRGSGGSGLGTEALQVP